MSVFARFSRCGQFRPKLRLPTSLKYLSSNNDGGFRDISPLTKQETEEIEELLYDRPKDSREPKYRNSKTNNLEGLKKILDTLDTAEKKISVQQSVTKEDSLSKKSFATLLRESSFTAIGDPGGRVVKGTIFEVLGDDLYIDFGGKFHCVCTRPKENSE